MYNVTVPMALMDFIPVLFFAVTMILLQRDLSGKLCKEAFTLFASGTINVFCAGFLKATWKLLYAAGICDFRLLNTLFLPLQSIGFLLICFGLAGLLRAGKRRTAALAVAPPVFGGTFLFIGMMVLGLAVLCAALSVLAARLKKKRLIVLFALSFVCYMGMGYLSGQDSASAAVNWIEQSINCVGQGLLMWGVIGLHRAGLNKLNV